MAMEEIIQLSQLEVLGFHAAYRKLTIVFIMLLIAYVLAKPVMAKLVQSGQVIFLNLLLVSLAGMNLALYLSVISDDPQLSFVTLQAIAIFGAGLTITLSLQYLWRSVRRRWGKRRSVY